MLVTISLTLLVASALAYPSPQSGFPKIGFPDRFSQRVVGGEDASPHQFPYQVSIQWNLMPGVIPPSHMCGASIINNNWVLTAGHCITEAPSVGRLEIVAGKHNIAEDESTEQRILISSKIVHPLYQGGVNEHDIALIRLASPLVFNDAVKPISLPEPDAIHSGPVTLSGWGSTSTSIFPILPKILQFVEIPIIEYAECDKLIGEFTPLAPTNICTGPLEGGKSACSGDSGGPLVHIKNGEPTLIGIVSWGFIPCGSANAPSVYCRTSHYIKWIEDNINE